MKTTIHLSAALRALVPAIPDQFFSGVLLDPRARAAVATDGAAIAILPFPENFTTERRSLIPAGPDAMDAAADAGTPMDQEWGWEGIEEMIADKPPIYRIILDAARLQALAAAMGAGEVTLEFRDAESPVKVTIPHDGGESPPENAARGYLMPSGGCGLIAASATASVAAKPAAKLPPPVVTASAERGTLEINFGGKPEKSVLETLKSPALAFRYSGDKGTKRGVPPRTWYGPDNPFTREQVSGILGIQVAA